MMYEEVRLTLLFILLIDVTLEFCCVIVFGMGWVLLLEPS